MSTVSIKQTSTYVLAVGAPDLTFSHQTYIDVTSSGPGVFGVAGTAWTIGNEGEIVGDDAVDFAGSATFWNAKTGEVTAVGDSNAVLIAGAGVLLNAGTLSAKAVAIDIKGKGVVANEATGVINGGVLLEAGGSVANSGAITIDASSAIGVDLAAGGDVTNSGAISATGNYETAILLSSASASSNAGHITLSGSGDIGVSLTGAWAGVFTNSGYIVGQSAPLAVGISGGPAGSRVVNSGEIELTDSIYLTGIALAARGAVVNSGEIIISATGDSDFGIILGAGGSVTNSGSIAVTGAPDADGVAMTGGFLNNTSTGSIKASGIGVLATGSGGNVTVVDAGLISGADSVFFADSGFITNTLVLESGARLVGAVVCNTSFPVVNVLELEGSGQTTNTFVGFQALSVEDGANWTLKNAVGTSRTTVHADATLTVGAAGELDGTLALDGGTAIFLSAYDNNVTFHGVAELELSKKSYSGVIYGLAKDDKIDFLGFAYAAGDHAVVSGTRLTIETAANAGVVSFNLGNSQSTADFNVISGVNNTILLEHV